MAAAPPYPPSSAPVDVPDVSSAVDDVGQAPTWWLVLIALLGGSAWDTWRTRLAFHLLEFLFALSALPFALLLVGPIRQLVTRAHESGYTRTGRLVRAEPHGLSAQLAWMRESILDSTTRVGAEMQEDIRPADRQALKQAVTRAERELNAAWERPLSARQVTDKAGAALEELLAGKVTREIASDTLFTSCFPSASLVANFVIAPQDEARMAEVNMSVMSREIPAPVTQRPEPVSTDDNESEPELLMAW